MSVSVRTVRRVLKASGFIWKRIRTAPGKSPDPEEYGEKKKQLKILHEKAEKGKAEVRYYDESGFSLTPCSKLFQGKIKERKEKNIEIF